MQVYRCSVSVTNGKLGFEDPHPVDMPLDLFNKFSWNKIIRVDLVDKKTVVFLSDVKIALEGVWIGMQAGKDLLFDAEEYFENYSPPEGTGTLEF